MNDIERILGVCLLGVALATCGPGPDPKGNGDDDVIVINNDDSSTNNGSTNSDSGTNSGDGNNSDTETNSGTTGDTLTCEGIFNCVTSCPADDQQCGEDCVASGDSQSRALFQGWLSCLQDNGCLEFTDDADAFEGCVRDNCAAETNACANDEPQPEPANNTADGGDNPEELVGMWSTVNTTTDLYDPGSGTWGNPNGDGVYEIFRADGSWEEGFYFKAGSGTCVTRFMSFKTGDWFVDDQGTLVTVRRDFRSNYTDCGNDWEEDRNTDVVQTNWNWTIDQPEQVRILVMDDQATDVVHRLQYDGPAP